VDEWDDVHAKDGEQGREDETTQAKLVDPYKPQISFPQSLAKDKLGAMLKKIEILKTLNINISFLEAILEMHSYAKFLKDMLSNKRWRRMLKFPSS